MNESMKFLRYKLFWLFVTLLCLGYNATAKNTFLKTEIADSLVNEVYSKVDTLEVPDRYPTKSDNALANKLSENKTVQKIKKKVGGKFSLDSIAAWGKFPNFCIKVYHWGDKFFNTVDTTYVRGTGYKFNGRLEADSWLDFYSMDFSNNSEVRMVSHPSTAIGPYLTYLAVSVGYGFNVSKMFGKNHKSRKKFDFSFTCALLSANLSYYTNNSGTNITRLGEKDSDNRKHISFSGVDTKSLQLSAFYFLNNKRYSHGAAFSFSKIQRKSAGSFVFGFKASLQEATFDFSELPQDMKDQIPRTWDPDNPYLYHLKSNNYSFILGYGYNWVFAPKWLLGVVLLPNIGWRYGYNEGVIETRYGFAINNRTKVSIIYNHKKWFAGILADNDMSWYWSKYHLLTASWISVTVKAGIRFNLW